MSISSSQSFLDFSSEDEEIQSISDSESVCFDSENDEKTVQNHLVHPSVFSPGQTGSHRSSLPGSAGSVTPKDRKENNNKTASGLLARKF